jgi:SAM-dependent MidA family methyltransferase
MNKKVISNILTSSIKTYLGIPIDIDNQTTQEIAQSLKGKKQIPFSKFMEISLYGNHGYYSSGKLNIGNHQHDDFTTASEKDPLFAMSIVNSLLKTWESMGKPSTFNVVEMGAGRGVLAERIHTLSNHQSPIFFKALHYTIVELSQGLIKKQKKRLEAFSQVNIIQGSAYNLPIHNVSGVFISNELPDMFPIEVVRRINGQIKQKFITIEDNQWVEIWDTPTNEVTNHISKFQLNIIEAVDEPINDHATTWFDQLCKGLKEGIIITFDYGTNKEVGTENKNTIRSGGFQKTGKNEMYRFPGKVDITADVNFKPLQTVADKNLLTTIHSGHQGAILDLFGDRATAYQDIMTVGLDLKLFPELKLLHLWDLLFPSPVSLPPFEHSYATVISSPTLTWPTQPINKTNELASIQNIFRDNNQARTFELTISLKTKEKGFIVKVPDQQDKEVTKNSNGNITVSIPATSYSIQNMKILSDTGSLLFWFQNKNSLFDNHIRKIKLRENKN